MVIDSSVFLAIFLGEEEGDSFIESIAEAGEKAISAVTFVETAMVLERKIGEQAVQLFRNFVEEAKIEIVDVTTDVANEALLAYRRFGKGNHKASLNFGDVFSYATAKLMGYPLLFKGRDFIHTDLQFASGH